MSSASLGRFWEILGWVFALNEKAFQAITQHPQGLTLAVIVVVLAGLSQAIAQSIILFINQVKPLRFFLSLLLNIVLFAAGFFFLVFSTWLITLIPWSIRVPFMTLLIVLGISYAPLLFSFFGALPYFGVPILTILSIWHLLAMVVGVASTTGLRLGSAFTYVVFGWVALQVLQQTIGQPIANFGRWLTNQVAGVDLATNQQDVMDIVRSRVENSRTAWQEEFQQRISELRQGDLLEALTGDSTTGQAVTELVQTGKTASSSGFVITQGRNNQTLRNLLSFVAIAVATFLIVVFLRPLRDWWFGWYENLPRLFRFIFDLGWISIVALVVAGLMAPLETLGWWAGWYDDKIDTTLNAGELAQPVADPQRIKRYIVYLDGICQSDFKYLPDVEEFLDTLTPTLPEDMALLRGLMTYSVLNNPLNEDRPLAFLWKLADRNRYANPADLLGMLVNLRNVIIVAVSADQRYGPLYNQGIAQIVYNGLLKNGYQPGSGVPVTLIGYSGGGQMSCASAPYLKQALRAPVDVISLGGVISANNNILTLEHLYHLVGDKDSVEQLGPIMFPGRWKLFFLSYWNRAKRRGKITFKSMGPVGHQVPGGILCPKFILPDGRSALQQTIDTINTILRGEFIPAEDLAAVKLSNYELYMQAAFNRPDYYPIQASPAPALYQPIGTWMGRLILPQPEQRQEVQGALFEVYHTDTAHADLVGKTVNLRWQDDPKLHKWLSVVRQDVHFSAEASYTSKYGGLVHPNRLNHWLQVDPLESLAGARPEDDVVVMLNEPVQVEGDALYITNQPVQITGRFYALVKFLHPIAGTDQFRVVHFNRSSRQFDGVEDLVRVPDVLLAKAYSSLPSTSRDIEKSPYNETGWYIYGAQDAQGQFVVQSWGPRALFKLQPDEVIFGKKAIYSYIRKRAWANVVAQKGRLSSVLGTCRSSNSAAAIQMAIEEWKVGDRALVLHTYGGIGGVKREPAAATPVFFGHFALGWAKVIHDPLSDELRFDLRYHQVYTHNTDGLIAGTIHWSRYLGDRQFGWLGCRPVCDILIKHPAFTEPYDFYGTQATPLDAMLTQLQVMTARYRTGDGTGGTYVGPANNCAQDSNQALFASLRQTEQLIRNNADLLRQWGEQNPDQAKRFQQLLRLGNDLKLELQPWGGPKSAWERNEFNLGSTLEDQPIRNLLTGLGSWRTMLPRLASDTVVRIFLDYGASVWVLRTNQVGGYDPDIEPIAPMTL